MRRNADTRGTDGTVSVGVVMELGSGWVRLINVYEQYQRLKKTVAAYKTTELSNGSDGRTTV
jgi:hypothetical protein